MEMTLDDAIRYGNEWLKDEYLDAKDAAFIKAAIKALKDKFCEDAISREDALMALTGEWTDRVKSIDNSESY